ncbi:V-type ATP synthase subunit F [Fastidiosipila sanguinis]|uniref:V-type ATP synthase subunit F n=1 Tax=Fastidiosipila sanguinis TaxID=236753 RepID=A0A2S0KLL5_9FIRM|nr:V-type ATP synthase subunit F [Fastidiosipila sanguinis]AVM41908.1 hypothetical protein C5Q98_01060 [Fastidiosipila sanguinis]
MEGNYVFNNEDYEIAHLGEAGSFAGAAALGINVFTLDPEEETSKQLEDLILSGKYAIIYISAKVASEAEEIVDAYADEFVPAIITLPSADSDIDTLGSLRNMVIKAIGVDLVSGYIEEEDMDKTGEENGK